MIHFNTQATWSAIARRASALIITGLLFSTPAVQAAPQEFTYQALITNNAGNPATTTNANVTLGIYDAPTGGNLVKSQSYTSLNLASTGGYVNLTVPSTGLDPTDNLYVEVRVQDVAGGGSVEILSPRQKIGSVPFALSSQSPLTTRTLFVNPNAPGMANPKGTIDSPYTDIAAAYARAKTLNRVYSNRVVVMLMPGQHALTSTLNLDAEAIDLVGFGEKSAIITGSVNPLINATGAGSSGPVIRNMIFQADIGSSNRLIDITAGRIQNVIMNRAEASAATAGVLVKFAASTQNISLKDFELAGDLQVDGYGPGATISNGYLNNLISTGSSASATSLLAVLNVSGIANISFAPAGAYGILALSNCPQITGITYAPNTVLQAASCSFMLNNVPIALPNPLAGSLIANSIANIAAWAPTTAASTGNVAGEYVSYARK